MRLQRRLLPSFQNCAVDRVDKEVKKEHQKELQEEKKVTAAVKNKNFNNFDRRDYDFGSLEDELLKQNEIPKVPIKAK